MNDRLPASCKAKSEIDSRPNSLIPSLTRPATEYPRFETDTPDTQPRECHSQHHLPNPLSSCSESTSRIQTPFAYRPDTNNRRRKQVPPQHLYEHFLPGLMFRVRTCIVIDPVRASTRRSALTIPISASVATSCFTPITDLPGLPFDASSTVFLPSGYHRFLACPPPTRAHHRQAIDYSHELQPSV